MLTVIKKTTFTLIALILVLSCAYGIFLDYQTAFAATQLESRYEYNDDYSTGYTVYGSYYEAQTFTPTTSHTITGVFLCLKTVGSPSGDMTVEIQETTGSKPEGTVRCSGTLAVASIGAGLAWLNIDFGAGYALVSGTEYAIVAYGVTGSAGNDVYWALNGSSSYTGGVLNYSTDSGANWTTEAKDFAFSEWGLGQYYSGNPATFDEANINGCAVSMLGDDEVVVAYKHSDSTGIVRRGTVTNSYIDWDASSYVYDLGNDTPLGIMGLTSTTFVVVYLSGSSPLAKIGTVSSGIISYGDAQPLGTGNTVYNVATLDSSHFIVAYKSTLDSYPAYDCPHFSLFSISGNTVTLEDTIEALGGGTTCNDAGIARLSDTRVALFGIGRSGTDNTTTTGVWNIVSEEFVFVDSETVTLDDTTAAGATIVGLSSTSYIVVYPRTTGVFSLGRAKVFVLVGSTLSVGSEETYDYIGSSGYVNVASLSESKIAIAYYDGGTHYGEFVTGEVDSTDIEWSNVFRFNQAATITPFYSNLLPVVSSTTFIVPFEDSDTYGKAVVISTQTFPIWEPIVSTDAASGISADDVTMNGTLDYDGDAECEYRFGISTVQGGPYYYSAWSVGAALTSTDTFDTTLTDELWAGQTFYYVAECDNGYVGTGAEESFTTTGVYDPDAAPAVATGTANPITDAGATLYGSVSSLGDYATIYGYIQYGTTTSYGTNTAEQEITAIGEYHADITGLAPGTVYHYRAIVRYHTYAFTYGDDRTFLTTGSTSTIPIVTTSPATSITTTSATLNGALTTLGLYSSALVGFEYDLDISDANYEFSTPWQTFTAAAGFNAAVTALEVQRTYHFRATCLYGAGSQIYGDDLTFVTDQTGIIPVPPGVLPGETGIESLPENIVPIWPGAVDAFSTPAGAPTDNPFYEPIDIVVDQTNTGFTTDQVFFWGAAVLTIMVGSFCLIRFRNHLLVSGIATMACIAFFVGWNGIFPYWLLFPGGAFLLWSLNSERQPSV